MRHLREIGWGLLLALAPFNAWAEPFKATLYELGSKQQKPLFTMEVTEHKEGDVTVRHSSFKDLEGKELVIEDVRLLGWKLDNYALNILQDGEFGTEAVHDNRVWFQYTRPGKFRKDDESAPEALIVGPNTIDYLKTRFEDLLAGKTVTARFGIPDRCETVGFKFFKDADTTFNGRKAIIVKMKPASFLIAAIVNPLYVTLDAENGRLLELVGRTIPKKLVNGDWKDIEADMVLSYPTPDTPNTPPSAAPQASPSITGTPSKAESSQSSNQK